jgi:ATP-dependent DNA helicase RecG
MNGKAFEDFISDLCSLPHETEWVEFKTGYFDADDVGEYLSALSNSACLRDQRFGYLVFGVEDKTHDIVGTPVDFNSEKIGNQDVALWLHQMMDGGVEYEADEGMAYGKKVLVLKIAAAVSVPTTFKGKEYIRHGSHKTSLKSNKNKARDLWAKLANEVFEERWALENLTTSDSLRLLNYEGVFSLLEIPKPETDEGVIDKLCEEKLLEKHEGRLCITNLGAMLFANNLGDFPQLDRKRVRVIVYDGNTKTSLAKEVVGRNGYATGFDGLIEFIYNSISTKEDFSGPRRRLMRPFTEIQIRELTANALTHQDLTLRGTSPMIEVFTDRIEFSNPGMPLIDDRRFLDHSPRSRNEMMAALLRRIGVAEERGTGIDKVVEQSEILFAPALRIKSTSDSTRVTLFAPRPYDKLDKQERVNAAYEHACHKHVSDDYLTNESLRTRLSIPEDKKHTASRIINDAVEAGVIKPASIDNTSRKYAKYVPFYA